MKIRVGVGFDAHPFSGRAEARRRGPAARGRTQGHSDGDALLHAITDAILGAAGRARSATTSRPPIRSGREPTARSSWSAPRISRATVFSSSTTSTPWSSPRRLGSRPTRRGSASASPRFSESTPTRSISAARARTGWAFRVAARASRRWRWCFSSRRRNDPFPHPSHRGGRTRAAAGDRVGSRRHESPRPAHPRPEAALPRERGLGPVWRPARARAAGGEGPPGVAARLAVRGYLEEEAASEGPPGSRFLLVLDEVQDPHNLGAVLRVADAVGAGVVVPERGTAPLSETVSRSSAGAVERVPVYRARNLRRFVDRLEDQGFRVIGLDAGGAGTLFDLDLTGDLALVLGAEGKGIRRLVREGCDELGRLPMSGEGGLAERLDGRRRGGVRGGPPEAGYPWEKKRSCLASRFW